MTGPRLRTDIVDAYVFRRDERHGVEFLQLLRAGEPLKSTWHPVMGHVEAGESAVQCALRELEEETGLARENPALLGVWALEQVHPFYVAAMDCVVLSPRFAVEVSPEWSPTLDSEHSNARWVSAKDVGVSFLWPSQRAACAEIIAEVVPKDSPAASIVRIDARNVPRA
jgi:8-oxo-dGTP pyrophosphatase MutT (NUDIX family)